MSVSPSPRQILETLLPHLRVAARYAQHIQARIVAQPDKSQANNPFAAALSDADLSIQTLIEVALLGTYPQVRFFGEEHQQSYNTKYFRSIQLGPRDDYLITLDPIDGTRFYLDGHNNYQIILTVLNVDTFEAVLALSPAHQTYTYALRGGAWQGHLTDSLDACQTLDLKQDDLQAGAKIFLGSKMGHLTAKLQSKYRVVDVLRDYSSTTQISNFNGLLCGDFAGAALAYGNLIDGAALAFIAQQAGCIVTTLEGAPLPPFSDCEGMQLPGLLVAASTTVHEHLLQAVREQSLTDSRRQQG